MKTPYLSLSKRPVVCEPWSVITTTRQGRRHRRGGVDNQDAVFASHLLSSSGWMTAAVADGHGGEAHFRSRHGSRLAVLTACDEWAELFRTMGSCESRHCRLHQASRMFPDYVATRWRRQIKTYFSAHPLRKAELADLSPASLDRLRFDPSIACGTTLLSASVRDDCLFAAQIGDGAMIRVDADGSARFLLPIDDQHAVNQTNSLCQPDAHNHFRTTYRRFLTDPPALLLLCTDGYANAFADGDALLQAGTDILSILRREGPRYVSENLGQWVSQTSDGFSDDDATVALLFRNNALWDEVTA